MLFDLFRNYLNALVGRNQEFEKLLAAKDISAVKERMGNRMDMAIAALKEYEVTSHEIMKREDKIITDKMIKLPAGHNLLIHHAASLHPAAHTPGSAALNNAAVLLSAAPGQQSNPGSALNGFGPDEFRAGKQGCWYVHVFHNQKSVSWGL